MKDAKGHGSDPRGAAHQAGIEQATNAPRFWNDVRDAYGGGTYGSIRADPPGGLLGSGKSVGSLDYVAGYEGGVHKTHVQMIATDPSARRHGIATGMVDKLKQEFPGTRIKWGMRTPEGQAFIRNYYGKRK